MRRLKSPVDSTVRFIMRSYHFIIAVWSEKAGERRRVKYGVPL
jgi:hypothetical protein